MGSLFVKTRSTSPRFKLKLYLIDISRGTVFESEGDSDRTTSIAQKAFSDFLPGMRAASQAQ